MATEKLVVELDADVSDYLKGMAKADRQNKDTEKSSLNLGKGVAAVGTAAIAAGAALATMITVAAGNRRELEQLSRQTKMNVDEFKALTFATKTAGINAEQFADISKDLADKLGEFSTAGSGAFQDFADVVGLTKDEAQLLATEFEDLTSEQVIGKMVSMMEDAGASTNDMTFALESMGNDLSRLLPIFQDGAKGANDLKNSYKAVTDGMELTGKQAEDLKDAANNFTLLTDTAGEAVTKISSVLAPALNGFFNSVIEVVPNATQAIVNFMNSFIDAENIRSIAEVETQIKNVTEEMDSLATAHMIVSDAIANNDGMFLGNERNQGLIAQAQSYSELTIRLAELTEQLRVLREEQEKIGDAESIEGGVIAIGEAAEATAEAEVKKQEDIKDTGKVKADISDAMIDHALDELKHDEKAEKEKGKAKEAGLQTARAVTDALFQDNKAYQAGAVVVDTARAITRQFADLPYPAALGTSALIAASGAAQLSNILSSDKGSSSAPSGAGGGGVPDVSEVAPETSTLDISTTVSDGDSSQTGSLQFVQVVGGDTGDQMLAEFFNQSLQNGRIERG